MKITDIRTEETGKKRFFCTFENGATFMGFPDKGEKEPELFQEFECWAHFIAFVRGGEYMTVEELRNSDAYYWHHTGSRRGYESRKGNGHVEHYKGRFGEGYSIISPRYDTTQYVNVEYYIKK